MRTFTASSLFALLCLSGCISSIMKYEKADQMNSIDEFDKKLKIDRLSPETMPETSAKNEASPLQSEKKIEEFSNTARMPAKPKKSGKSKLTTPSKLTDLSSAQESSLVATHEPQDVEGNEGFVARRPLKDPFWVGEKVLHEVTYLGVLAGNMVLSVEPFTLVNGRKSYEFTMRAWTRSLFSAMYAADDTATNLVDFESLVPSAFFLHIKESKQLEESRGLFDQEKATATFWQRRKTPSEPEVVKKKEWSMPAYSQNVFSAAFYMRVFPWKLGDEHSFRVTDNAENLLFRARALRQEILKTSAGDFKAIVVKPEVQLQGVAKPVGDLFIWLSDDDRKFILRIEAKIKIGSFVSEVVELDSGLDPLGPTPEKLNLPPVPKKGI